MTKMNSDSDNIIKIIKDEVTIVSFMLLFVTFLFKENLDTNGIFAKPLVLFICSAICILYGIIIRIFNLINQSKYMKFSNLFDSISLGFYILSIFLFIISCDFLLAGIQGADDLPIIYKYIRVIIIALGSIPISAFLLSVLYNQRKSKEE